MTYLELVNAVMRRLRVDEVGFVSDLKYSVMIGDFVNQAKREVEDAYNWLALESNLPLSIVAATSTYTLTGFGRRARIRLVHDLTNRLEIKPIDWDKFQHRLDFGAQSGPPSHWRINGLVGDDPILELYPTPNAASNVTVYATVPQADLTNDSTEMTVPFYPVILGAYTLAVAERGDDRGAAEQQAQAEYQQALADAISRDNFNANHGYSTDWVVV